MSEILLQKPSFYKDLFGHLTRHKLYTTISVCFPLEDPSLFDEAKNTLVSGLERLSVSFPWLAAQVVGGKEADWKVAGHPEIVPLDRICRMLVNNLAQNPSFPSFETLRTASFPIKLLDGELLTNLSGMPNAKPGDPAPVFFIQANIIQGGLILTFCGEHSAVDGHGLGQVMRLLDKACHDEPFTEEDLTQGNRGHEDVIPLLDRRNYKPGTELDYLVVKPVIGNVTGSAESPETPTSTWAVVHFSADEISRIKALASPSVGKNSQVKYVSSNDAVSAFIWQATARARVARLAKTDNAISSTSTFGRAVDVRSSLSIPSTYLGNMSNHTYTTLPLSSVASAPLSDLAMMLRTALHPEELSYGIRSLATYIATNDDISNVTYGANMDFSRDLFFSSWAGLPCYSLDYNLGLGLPVSVRRPKFGAFEGLMYLLPMDREKGIDAVVCLRDGELEALEKDTVFMKYARWIG